MKKLPSHGELTEWVEMFRNFEQKIKEQCDLAEKLYVECEKHIQDRFLENQPTEKVE